MYQKIGAVLNASPLKVQNLLEGYLAGYTKIPAQIVDMLTSVSRGEPIETNDKSILRRFIKETYPSNANRPATTPEAPPLMERLFGKASAASDTQTKPLDDWQIADEKYRLRKTDEQTSRVANMYFYKKPNGDIGTIDTTLEDSNLEIAKVEVKRNQEAQTIDNNYIYYDPDSETAKTIDLTFEPQEPELTGQEELDKKLTSKYKGEVTQKINDIVKLHELGQYTAEEAEKLIKDLKGKSEVKTGTGKKAKKSITVKMPTLKVPKVATSRVKKITLPKPKKITLKQYKIKAPKLKESSLLKKAKL
jgi:hypothetical protein